MTAAVPPMPQDPYGEIERLKTELEASVQRELALVARLAREAEQRKRWRRKLGPAHPDLFT